MRKVIPMVVCAFLFCGDAAAADLPIGPMLFTLGAPQSEVMAEVGAKFRVISVTGKPGMYFLADASSPSGKVIGGISFKEGRLNWVQRTWGNFDATARAHNVATALYSAIASATAATGSRATVTTKIDRVPGTEFRTTEFQFPGHKVTLLQSDGENSQVTVSESISL